MIDTLHLFQERISQLLAFLDDVEIVNALADTELPLEVESGETLRSRLASLRANQVNRRVQSYASAVVLLYGLFEQYVEEVLMAYLDELSTIIRDPDDIPEKIRESHTNLSAQLLLNRDLEKYRDRFREIDVIQRMHSCASGGPFLLNALAFTDHRSNFRQGPLNEFFVAAGISNMLGEIKHSAAFRQYTSKRFADETVAELDTSVVFEDLDDLAWRRNVVSHGWPDDLLSIDMMRQRAGFVRVIGESIYEVLRQSLLPYMVKYNGSILPRPVAVYRNAIVCFHLTSGAISQGSLIVARAANERYLEGQVESIEVDHVRKSCVTAPPAVNVGCCVSFKAKQNYDYFLIQD